MKLIEKSWNEYRETVVSPAAGPIQINETRLAFYAGAAILFTLLTKSDVLDEGTEPTEKDLEQMAAIQAEIQEFGQELDKKMGVRRQ